MKFGCHLKSFAQRMTDQERDVIDAETDKILSICTQLIIELRQDVKKSKMNQQNSEYMENVLESLTTYLKNVFGISNQMRTYRVKKELETYKLLKLKADKRDIPETPKLAKRKQDQVTENIAVEGLRRRHGKRHSVDEEDEEWIRPNDDFSGSRSDKGEPDDYDSGTDTGDFPNGQQALSMSESTTRQSIPSKLALDEEIAADQSSYILDEEEQNGTELSPEDIQMFELENKQLLSELKGLSEEISQIEKNVSEITKLQDLFTEKVNQDK